MRAVGGNILVFCVVSAVKEDGIVGLSDLVGVALLAVFVGDGGSK